MSFFKKLFHRKSASELKEELSEVRGQATARRERHSLRTQIKEQKSIATTGMTLAERAKKRAESAERFASGMQKASQGLRKFSEAQNRSGMGSSHRGSRQGGFQMMSGSDDMFGTPRKKAKKRKKKKR